MEDLGCGMDGGAIGEAECLVTKTEPEGWQMVVPYERKGREEPSEDAGGVFEGCAGFAGR
jgi:hypothetical protein